LSKELELPVQTETFSTDQALFFLGALVATKCKQPDMDVLLERTIADQIDTITVQPLWKDGVFGR